MKIVFISNFFSHHQKFVSDCFFELTDGNYWFISTTSIPRERTELGYREIDEKYVIQLSDSNFQWVQELIDNADAVIIGSASDSLIQTRLNTGKVVFRYSERPLKKGFEPLKFFYRLIKWHKHNPKNAHIFMLCSSAYTASDFRRFGLFKDKCFKWGYFPETKIYNDFNSFMTNKNRCSILWVGRFITWKHPEIPVKIALALKKRGYIFKMTLVGDGPLFEDIKLFVKKNDLNNYVILTGSLPFYEVRTIMEKSEIFLFTSDRQEGWGAVLNEAMNSACAVIANQAIGSVPYLLINEVNGIIVKNLNINYLIEKVEFLINDERKRIEFGRKAYETITSLWNSKEACKRFYQLAYSIINKKELPNFVDGPCSKE